MRIQPTRCLGPDLDISLPVQVKFQRGYLAQTAEVALCPTELTDEKRLNKIPGHGGPNGPAAHTNDIHVIILNPLLSREMIMNESGAYAGDLVGAYRSADAAAADCYPGRHLTRSYRPSKWNYHVGIVV